jgi:hypothetical protein
MYLNHPKRHGGDRKPSQFVLADPAKTNPMSFELIQQGSCKGQPAEKAFNSISALGGLWAQVCSTYGDEISASSASLNTLSLDPDHCNSLVKKYWTDTKPKLFNNKNFMGNKKIVENILQDLTIEDLLAACPRNKFDATVPNGNTGGVGNTQKEPPIPGKCMECHDGEIPFDNWQELRTRVAKSGRPFVDEILDRIERTGSGKMPPRSQTITAAEKEAFVLYLKTGVIP